MVLIPVFWNQYGDEIQISMKTYKNLYTRIWIYENLYETWRRAARRKRKSLGVAGFEYALTDNLLRLSGIGWCTTPPFFAMARIVVSS